MLSRNKVTVRERVVEMKIIVFLILLVENRLEEIYKGNRCFVE